MTHQEIIENNKLIAEFMGKEPITGLEAYDTSWDWLMPVKHKIELLDEVVDFSIGTCFVNIELVFGCDIAQTIYDTDVDPIFKVWLAVVDFIKWYNPNKDNNG